MLRFQQHNFLSMVTLARFQSLSKKFVIYLFFPLTFVTAGI